MRIILDSTTELGTIEVQGVQVPARFWIGRTEGGEPIAAFITRLAPLSPSADSALARELQEAPHEELLTVVDREALPGSMNDFGDWMRPEDPDAEDVP